MNIEKLIALADLLDAKGEHAAANEIDEIIKKAGPENELDVDNGGMPTEEEEAALEKAEAETAEKLSVGLEEAMNVLRSADYFRIQLAHSDSVDKLLGAIDAFVKDIGKQVDMTRYDRADDKMAMTLDQLSKIADELDGVGATKEADMIDRFIEKHADIMDYSEDRKEEGDTEQSKRYDDKHHHSLLTREPKRDQERVDREGRKEHHVNTYKPHEGHLSQRDCPEHLGTMLGRVGPGVYQCPRDGAIFNWETGYTTLDGKQVPGGSVAAQTPDSTGYAIPHRVFDSRDKVLNVIN